ncbi:MAG: hypothetical protein A3G24_13910 [Betaproteobacteria bacterium RIFCSPLOWO2_12_FULL_62_13]|nr:MAG: hypothetical protein A3G24_13910 [Betaproteobacteria bacterium RIFCSPLOWO2_12_FULL_62_13]
MREVRSEEAGRQVTQSNSVICRFTQEENRCFLEAIVFAVLCAFASLRFAFSTFKRYEPQATARRYAHVVHLIWEEV